jgi:hypothetical protein
MERWTSGILILLAACGSTPHRAPVPAARVDDAVELASFLPDEMQSCVVARPARLSSARRSLVLLHSRAEPIAWARDVPVLAYASALAERPDGRRARRTYLRVASQGREPLRRALAVRWDDQPCRAEQCRLPRARWLDERTVEIARYGWPRSRPGVRGGQCVALARDHIDALEATIEASTSFEGMMLDRAWLTRGLVWSDATGISTRRVVDFADPERARMLVTQLRVLGPESEATLVPLGASHPRIARDRSRVSIDESHRWDELELALEDERLRLRAIELDNQRNEPLELDRVNFENLGAVRHQVSLRRAELARLTPDARPSAAQELADLLERAWTAHPSEVSFASSLVRLSLDELGAPERALSVIDRVLSGAIADPTDEWRSMRREALAALSERRLADALIADRIATRSEARRAAADLRALRTVGVSYEWAESAWRLSRELVAETPMRAVHAQLALEGALGALVAWVLVSGPAAPSQTIQIVVRSSQSGAARAIGESRPDLIAVRTADGVAFVGGLPSIDLVALRRLGALVAANVHGGTIDLAIALRDPDGADLVRLRAVGRILGTDLAIERVSAPLADAPWPFLARYLAAPLAELPTALFPPPTLIVRTESAEVATDLRRRIDPIHPDACTVAGPILRCTTAASATDLLLEIAAARLH